MPRKFTSKQCVQTLSQTCVVTAMPLQSAEMQVKFALCIWLNNKCYELQTLPIVSEAAANALPCFQRKLAVTPALAAMLSTFQSNCICTRPQNQVEELTLKLSQVVVSVLYAEMPQRPAA